MSAESCALRNANRVSELARSLGLRSFATVGCGDTQQQQLLGVHQLGGGQQLQQLSGMDALALYAAQVQAQQQQQHGGNAGGCTQQGIQLGSPLQLQLGGSPNLQLASLLQQMNVPEGATAAGMHIGSMHIPREPGLYLGAEGSNGQPPQQQQQQQRPASSGSAGAPPKKRRTTAEGNEASG